MRIEIGLKIFHRPTSSDKLGMIRDVCRSFLLFSCVTSEIFIYMYRFFICFEHASCILFVADLHVAFNFITSAPIELFIAFICFVL